eukprot:GHVO01011599.1.p1 GENE.GHVO01011599.1~~GHVO01011599.1.p1  ORF type:complete len:393 (+),score=63.99 GHVO01011599.1:29-1180(+)
MSNQPNQPPSYSYQTGPEGHRNIAPTNAVPSYQPSGQQYGMPHRPPSQEIQQKMEQRDRLASMPQNSSMPQIPSMPQVPLMQPPSCEHERDDEPIEKIYAYINDLSNPRQREVALLELSKRREIHRELAPLLWHSFGTMAVLLQEIISIYPHLSPPTLTAVESNRVCNSLALLQTVATHPETREHFLYSHVPLFLYPFLNTVTKTRPFEYLRLTSLGVIGALVKVGVDESSTINFLLQTEIIPLCLRIMENGSDLSKTVASFIVQKILLDDSGLGYICATPERFYAVASVISNMAVNLAAHPSPRLLKHIIRCFLRLTDNHRALQALKTTLPDVIMNGENAFASCLREDALTKKWLEQLLTVIKTAANESDSLEENNLVESQQ